MIEGPSAAHSKGTPSLDPLIGRVIGGRFRVTALIARGGMGKVYRAEQSPLGRVCAIKVLNAGYAGEQDPEFHKRFFLEASVVAKLTHPNTVTIFDYGRTDDDIYYMVMEYLEGRTLHRAIRDAGHLPEERAAHVASQICRALREAHALGVIHRDLKPANIFLASHGDEVDFVKVLDFGLVKNVADKGDDLTQTGMFMGSPKYMSPEQIRGDRVDARTDVYGLGIILYEMLTGKVPFDRPSSVNILMAHVHEEPPPMSVTNPLVSLSLATEQAVAGCLAKDPERRFGSMDDVLVALRRVGAATSAPPTSAARTSMSSPDAGSGFPASRSLAPPSMEPPPGGSRPSEALQARTSLVSSPGSTGSNGALAMAVLGVLAVAGATSYVWLRPSTSPTSIATTPQPSAAAASAQMLAPAPDTAAPPAKQMKVRISTDPDGASVKENGIEVCDSTPCDILYKGADANPEREHNLTLARMGYRVEQRSVRASDSAVSVKLTPTPRAQPPPRAAEPAPAVPTGYKTEIPY